MEKTKRLLSGELIGNAMAARSKKVAGQSNSPEGIGVSSLNRPVVLSGPSGAQGPCGFSTSFRCIWFALFVRSSVLEERENTLNF